MEKPKGDRVVVRLDEISSTNTEMKLLQQKNPLPEGSMVIAEFQTVGRGQMGNTWYSSKGKNLLLSSVLYPYSVEARDQFIISRVVSLALKRVLNRYLQDVTIKWPNDIYWKNKKIAGILIENSLVGQHIEYTIVGIGLNVNEGAFPSELPNPVSMRQITGSELDRELLLKEVHDELFNIYNSLKRLEIAIIEKEYMQYLYRKEGVHWFTDENGRFKATIKTVLATGHLVLATYPEREERVYAFKEVAFVVEDD